MSGFDELETVRFQRKMKEPARGIYRGLFPGADIKDLREANGRVHVLDREFGIDAILITAGQQWLTIQEKYRRHSAMRFADFTQEYMNAAGTPHESPGEWFKLGAQLYFYGWADITETCFEKWALLDITRYKLFVEQAGGLDKIGTIHKNRTHGMASFFAIPIVRLQHCFVADYRHPTSLII